MLRRLKDDVLDLPEKTFIDEIVEMTPKQQIIYKEINAEIKSHIDEIEMVNNPLAALIRMRQATGYTGILSSEIQESAKLDRMKELVDEALENKKQVVIFSNWTQMTDAIMDYLDGYKYGIITGMTPDASRQSIIDKFQSKEYDIVIGTSGAMGTGITLTNGSVEIFLDEPWNMALKSQCVDRCHRIGQKNNLTIYTLMCKDTIDERIHEIVEKKGKMADALIDGNINMDKRELLEFLLN
jgi:SNF2 family DNA or RNA helicase